MKSTTTTEAPPDGLEIALAHAALGRRVFPMKLAQLASGKWTKTPLVKWQDDASSNPLAVRAMWRRSPAANAAGWTLPDGLIVADLDEEDEFAKTGHELPWAPSQATPSGGEHRLYSYQGVARQTVKATPGLDTRVGGKGFVGLYSVDAFAGDVVNAPSWLLHERPESTTASDEDSSAPIATRGDLLRLAGLLRHAGAGREAIAQELITRLADGRIESLDETRPWTREDMIQIAKSIGAKPPGPPIGDEFIGAPGSLVQPATKSTVADQGSIIRAMAAYSADVPTSVPWLVGSSIDDGLVYLGGVTLIAGKPKAGKSTLVADLVRAVLAGESFANEFATARARVLVLTEESGVAVVAKYGGLDVFVVDSGEAAVAGLKFSAVLAEARAWALSDPASALVVIDTFAIWAGVQDENDAGQNTRALAAVKNAFSGTNAAVLLVHHVRKSGGNEGDAVRGSSAIAATVDMVAELDYAMAGETSDRRVLSVRGRVVFPFRRTLDFERASRRYSVVDVADDFDAADVALLAALPRSNAVGVTRADLTTAWGKDARRDIARLIDLGGVQSYEVRDGRKLTIHYRRSPLMSGTLFE